MDTKKHSYSYRRHGWTRHGQIIFMGMCLVITAKQPTSLWRKEKGDGTCNPLRFNEGLEHKNPRIFSSRHSLSTSLNRPILIRNGYIRACASRPKLKKSRPPTPSSQTKRFLSKRPITLSGGLRLRLKNRKMSLNILPRLGRHNPADLGFFAENIPQSFFKLIRFVSNICCPNP
jgi:hypothetical protein